MIQQKTINKIIDLLIADGMMIEISQINYSQDVVRPGLITTEVKILGSVLNLMENKK